MPCNWIALGYDRLTFYGRNLTKNWALGSRLGGERFVLLARNHFGNTGVYLYRDGFHVRVVCRKHQSYHTSASVDGFGLVENKVAYAVIDGATPVLFDGLQGVGVMANKEIGPCVYQ